MRTIAAVGLLAFSLAGCVVAPVGPPVGPPPGVYVPPGVVYAAPVYPMPAPGYAWAYNGRYGWGWRHPAYGWHRGWQ